MYASLRFPTAPVAESEFPLPTGIGAVFAPFSLREEEISLLLPWLSRSVDAPEVLEYRSRFAEELYGTPALARAFEDLWTLGLRIPSEAPEQEADVLRTVARFEAFASDFDAFRTTLQDLIPESEAGRRAFRFLKRYGESFEYKELKQKACELLRACGFDAGAALAVEDGLGEEGTSHLFRADNTGSMSDNLFRVMEEFSLVPEETPVPPAERYTPTEAAILTGVIRGNGELSRRIGEFMTLYRACGTEDLLRLCREAGFFVTANKLYRKGAELGFPLCRPNFRPAGYYTELKGLSFPSQAAAVGRADFLTTPLNHVTVACGPDAEAYLDGVTLAHLMATAGGLVFAEEADLSPVFRLERGEKDQIRTAGLDEHSLCICGHLFDAMLPRQEEAACTEVLRRLCECKVRSAVRICGKSNLTALQKAMERESVPPCTLLSAGTDRTLEDLLKRHNLTAEELEENDD